MRLARKLGVKIIFGSDATPGLHGRNSDEFIFRIRDGFETPMDAIISATSLAAESIDLGDEIGTIAEGFQADLVAVEGNPLEDFNAFKRIKFVMKNGVVYKKKENFF